MALTSSEKLLRALLQDMLATSTEAQFMELQRVLQAANTLARWPAQMYRPTLEAALQQGAR